MLIKTELTMTTPSRFEPSDDQDEAKAKGTSDNSDNSDNSDHDVQ